jgi:hypothetical protein
MPPQFMLLEACASVYKFTDQSVGFLAEGRRYSALRDREKLREDVEHRLIDGDELPKLLGLGNLGFAGRRKAALEGQCRTSRPWVTARKNVGQ